MLLGDLRGWTRFLLFEDSSVLSATFGPVDARKASPKYGFITATPKPGWGDTDVLGLLGLRPSEESRPVLFDTDVNAPALAEFRHRCYLQKQQPSTVTTVSTKPLTSLSYIILDSLSSCLELAAWSFFRIILNCQHITTHLL